MPLADVMTREVDRLRVRDEAFLVASMIERCPKVMMLRELVQNALEAASLAPAHQQRVEIGVTRIDGVRKLTIWNTGPGMDAEELHRMCDLASSIGKLHSLDRNFGMGAKVASLPSNPHGIRYRSCKHARAHELLLGKRDGVYGRVRRADPLSDALAEVFDVTASASQAYALDSDWTEVVLLGSAADQDTVANPYAGDPEVSPWWIAEGLHERFFRLPDGIELWLGPETHPQPGRHRFVPITARMLTSFDRHEAVRARDGIVVHYLYDGPDPDHPGKTRSGRDALQPTTSVCGLVFKDEVYGLHRGWGWWHMAPAFGIPFAQRYLSIFIELPDNETVRPDAYRQFLRYRHGIQDQVFIRHFSALVSDYRPRWVIDLVRQHSPDHAHAEVVRDELEQLLKTLRIRRRYRPRPEAPPAEKASEEAEPSETEKAGDDDEPEDGNPSAEEAEEESDAADATPSPAEAHPKKAEPEAIEEYEPAPQLVPLREQYEIAAKALEGRAARFYPESHQLFVNLLYPAVEQMQQTLEAAFADRDQAPQIQELAQQQSEQAIMRRVGRALVFALAKREGVAFWQAWDVDRALAPESLSVAADDFSLSLESARAAIEARLQLDEREKEPV
jgi:hypothetical protein